MSWTAPSPGRYFASAVAYNRALEPSKVACSDGVTIDNTPPALTSIDITDVRVKPGLVKDTVTEEVWFIDSHRKRCKVDSEKYSSECL